MGCSLEDGIKVTGEEIETLKVLRRRVAAVKPSTIASAGGF